MSRPRQKTPILKGGKYKPHFAPVTVAKSLEDQITLKRMLDMRKDGYSNREIAEELGVPVASVINGVQEYWRRIINETSDTAESLREIETEKLERLERKWIQVATSQDLVIVDQDPNGNPVPVADAERLRLQLAATETLIKIMDRRAKMWGIDAPRKVEVSPGNWTGLRQAPLPPQVVSNVLLQIADGNMDSAQAREKLIEVQSSIQKTTEDRHVVMQGEKS